MSSSSPLLLHVWPGRWGLPSIDADCLEAILRLQLTLPRRRRKLLCIVETADADVSPTGRLPFLTHGPRVAVAPLSAIVGYVEGLDVAGLGEEEEAGGDDDDGEGDVEGGGEAEALRAGVRGGALGAVQSAQTAAWRAYIEMQLGDLVAHSFFVLDPNYDGCMRGEMAGMLPVPQRYYVPDRVREGYRPRLEAVGLWQLAGAPEGGTKAKGGGGDEGREMRRAFGQAKVVERARGVFDILARLLGDKSFVFNGRPTAVDLALAARIVLLLKAPLPNSALREILESSYPTLAGHASRTCDALFLDLSLASHTLPPAHTNLRELLTKTAVGLLVGGGAMAKKGNGETDVEEARRFRRYRWAWVGLGLFGTVGFAAANGLVRVEQVTDEGGEEEGSEGVAEEEE